MQRSNAEFFSLGAQVIESGFRKGGKNHPPLCHLYCHLLELSPYPEKVWVYDCICMKSMWVWVLCVVCGCICVKMYVGGCG